MAKVKDTKHKIIDGYIDHVLQHNEAPASVYKFSKDIGIEEKEFYEYFGSFRGIDQKIWNEFFDETHQKLLAEEVYANYSAREKLLAFYYTLLEVLINRRSFVVYSLHKGKKYGPVAPQLRGFRDKFEEYIKSLIESAISLGEIEDRQMLSDKYYMGFWPQLLFVLHYWAKDESAKFEKTDAAVEKAVNLSFELLGKNPVDSLLDFGKFIFERKSTSAHEGAK